MIEKIHHNIIQYTSQGFEEKEYTCKLQDIEHTSQDFEYILINQIFE